LHRFWPHFIAPCPLDELVGEFAVLLREKESSHVFSDQIALLTDAGAHVIQGIQ
jgi:hypothetical protein